MHAPQIRRLINLIIRKVRYRKIFFFLYNWFSNFNEYDGRKIFKVLHTRSIRWYCFFSNHITPCQEPTCFGNQLTMKNLFREPTGDEEPVLGTNGRWRTCFGNQLTINNLCLEFWEPSDNPRFLEVGLKEEIMETMKNKREKDCQKQKSKNEGKRTQKSKERPR